MVGVMRSRGWHLFFGVDKLGLGYGIDLLVFVHLLGRVVPWRRSGFDPMVDVLPFCLADAVGAGSVVLRAVGGVVDRPRRRRLRIRHLKYSCIEEAVLRLFADESEKAGCVR